MYRLFFIRCHGCDKRTHIPQPTLGGADSNPMAITMAGKRAAFVCSFCGLVSQYSDEEIHDDLFPIPDPFRSGVNSLQCIEPECDGKNCGAPKRIHVVLEAAKATDIPSFGQRMRDWKADQVEGRVPTCDAGHALSWKRGLYRQFPCESPF